MFQDSSNKSFCTYIKLDRVDYEQGEALDLLFIFFTS